MLVDEKVSVFDGIVVQTAEGEGFVDADQIGDPRGRARRNHQLIRDGAED